MKTIVITCGDGAIGVLEYLKNKLEITIDVVLTTAGASRTISLRGCEGDEDFSNKKRSVISDLIYYISDADSVEIIIVDHSRCRGWETYAYARKSTESEEEAHTKSINSAGKIILSELKKKINSSVRVVRRFYVKRGESGKIIEVKEVKPY